MTGNEKRREWGVFFRGAVMGALIGAALGIWNAPRSGRALRQALRSRGRALVGDVEQAATQARRQIEGESIDSTLREAKAEARRLNRGA
jgi:gas vesicle protein